jgi:hypothetical protein
MKNIILNIAILTVVMILANNFTTSAQTSKGNPTTTITKASTEKSNITPSTETSKTVKENNTKENNNTSSVKSQSKNNKPVKKHTFFLHLNNIALGNAQYA